MSSFAAPNASTAEQPDGQKEAGLASEGGTWWHNARAFTPTELFADAIVHSVGLVIALVLGCSLLAFVAGGTGAQDLTTLSVYVGSLIVALTISFVFNLAPIAPIKRLLARFDQAAIFLLIAGTYTAFLALLGGSPTGNLMLACVWAASLLGVALKLVVPQMFGRLALILYVGIGWSGLLIVQQLVASLPPTTLTLLFAGGITYSVGIVFHVWEKLRFQNVVWHCFVVAGATLHLWAIFDFNLQ